MDVLREVLKWTLFIALCVLGTFLAFAVLVATTKQPLADKALFFAVCVGPILVVAASLALGKRDQPAILGGLLAVMFSGFCVAILVGNQGITSDKLFAVLIVSPGLWLSGLVSIFALREPKTS